MASVVHGSKGKVASLFNIADDLLGGCRVLKEVGSPFVCNGPAEGIDPLLSTLGRDNGIVISRVEEESVLGSELRIEADRALNGFVVTNCFIVACLP